MFPQLGLNLTDYMNTPHNEGGFNFANTSQEQLSELSKALEAGSITGRETTNLSTASGSPLKIESLDRTLKLLTFKESDIVLWKKMPKNKAYNTVEEFNQLDNYGADRGGFILEGELPQEEDTTYVRRAQLVKFLGVVKSVTHVLTLTNTMVGNLIDKESKNGSMWILRKLNRSLAFGDSTIIPQEFNGLYQQHARPDGVNYVGGSQVSYLNDEVVVDLRGGVLTEDAVEEAARIIIDNFGYPTDLFAPPRVFSGYVKQQYQFKQVIVGGNGQNSYLGQKVPGQITNYGTINFNYDIFLREKTLAVVGQPSAAQTHPKAPAAPVIGGVAVVPVDANSKFETVDAGDYFYAVRAVNRFGQSALTVLNAGAAVALVAGNAVDLTFTAGVGAEPATGYEIYRSFKDGTDTEFHKIFEISTAELGAGFNGAAAGSVRELNLWLPDTDQAFMIQNNEEVHAFKQLAPLMKMDLAIVSPAYRFMILMYGTPLLYAPRKMVRFINIGTATA